MLGLVKNSAGAFFPAFVSKSVWRLIGSLTSSAPAYPTHSDTSESSRQKQTALSPRSCCTIRSANACSSSAPPL